MKKKKIKVLILGASGLIGSSIFKSLFHDPNLEVFGTIRSPKLKKYFDLKMAKKLIFGIEVMKKNRVSNLLDMLRPNIVINCIGLTKHIPGGNDPLEAIPVNAYLPHLLASQCEQYGCRLIHISSDCVFSGSRGGYLESDAPDAVDIYGKSKALGELMDGNAVTLRTSTIGHELNSSYGLLNWFLEQSEVCSGYKKAIFSGVTTDELARIIQNFVIPNPRLSGLYHVSGLPISKFDLLNLIAREYGKKIKIQPEAKFKIDRSLNGEKFEIDTGYKPQEWSKLIKMMHQQKQG